MAWDLMVEQLAINERFSTARPRIEAEGGRWGRPLRLSAVAAAKKRTLANQGALHG